MVSFNIKSGLESSLDDVGTQLESMHADLIGLQEVDVGVDRTQRADQAAVLAERLGMRHVFVGAIRRGGGDYGIALLSRLPLTRVERIDLSAANTYEHRVAIDASVCANGQEIRVITVHADNMGWSAAGDVHSLVAQLGALRGPLVLMGDLNATPTDEGPQTLISLGLVDEIRRFNEGRTFLGSNRRIDYIFATPSLDQHVVESGRVETTVSDHIPVFADFTVPAAASPAASPSAP